MSIFTLPTKWLESPTGAERAWVGIALLWCLVMSAMMPYWHVKGKQTSSGEAYEVAPLDFEKRVAEFTRDGKVGEHDGEAVVQPTPNGDAYLIGKNWKWYPVLKLKKDVTYRLHVSSGDYQHGLCILPMNLNFHVVPGYDHVIEITPTQTGKFPIICNEFCGAGHHLMTGLIIVE